MSIVNTTNVAAPRFTLIGGGSVGQIAEMLGKFGLSRPLVVSGKVMVGTGLIDKCLAPVAARRLAPYEERRASLAGMPG